MRVSRFVRYAPKTARFLLTAVDDALPNARRLVVSAPLTADSSEGLLTLAVSAASSAARGALRLAGHLAGTADTPKVTGVQVTDGGSDVSLSFGAVSDGQVLMRSGTSVVGGSVLPSSGGTLSGDLALTGHKVTGLASGTDTGDAATYGQLTAMINGLDWQRSVISALASPPGSPAAGDRHLIVATATGAWAGEEEKIAEWTGSAWTLIAPNRGYTVHNEATGQDLTYNGSHPSGSWVNIGASVDHASLLNLATGDPHTQYQLESDRNAASGYAGLDADGVLTPPARKVRSGSDPASPVAGELWVDGPTLKFRDGQGSPTTQLVVAGSRQVATSGGLSGGGDLTSNRTLSIAAFSGLVSKDIDPGALTWSANESKVHLTVDVGADGQLLPVAVRLPATVNGALQTEVVFEFDDASTQTLFNASTSGTLDESLPGLMFVLAGDLNSAAARNGRSVRKVHFRTRNTTGGAVGSTDIGAFRLRAWASPKGGGGAL